MVQGTFAGTDSAGSGLSGARFFPALLAAGLLAGCAGAGSGTTASTAAVEPGAGQSAFGAADCTGLASHAPGPDAITLPSRGVRIEEARRVTDGARAFCEVTGAIVSMDEGDPPVRVRINLPDGWNGKAVQFGGGGFDGKLVTAQGAIANGPEDAAPLAAGYVTFGSDGGHTGASPFDGSFGMNETAMQNYLGASVKRARDAAFAIASHYYGAAPGRTYFVGGSKGGHEALVAAQRYGEDYDGIVAYYPAQLLTPVWHRLWQAAYAQPGRALDSAQQALLKSAVLRACDGLDGLEDGIVGNTKACETAFDVTTLLCPETEDASAQCLSQGQIDALRVAAHPVQFDFPFAQGIERMGPFPVFEGGDLGGFYMDETGSDGTKTAYYGFNSGVIKYFITRDPEARVEDFDETRWQDRIQTLSAIWDAKDPDLDSFRGAAGTGEGHGRSGKLILIQGSTDMAVPPAETNAYFRSLEERYAGGLEHFARYYLVPGFGHGHGAFTLKWDALGALDRWVEQGIAPQRPIGIDGADETGPRSRPLCRFPAYPRYRGTGAPDAAASFECARP
ncbi:tannase/feruloyl esterase family alpha/beta hydrolase [Novosphingobium profundi]|uniref:tannase/feruloyl esterase family alpha/beta hydrolase n=1 Tax=Novosphingobium profundi TaxID=1774954 RepID=UPI001CFF05CE|nr:tannase/feruloyl esterase family alpha/beta hydrolase [Novosphingobium profundi]